jgi:TonB family protein
MGDQNHDIEKYRKGLLTKQQMNALEKKALSDPFLAEALEGAEEISPDEFSFDVNQLNQKILGRKRNWWPLGIAASFFLLATVAFLIYHSAPAPLQEKLTLAKPYSTKAKEPIKIDSSGSNKVNKKLLSVHKPFQKKPQTDFKPDSTLLPSLPSNADFAAPSIHLKDSLFVLEPVLPASLAEMREEATVAKTALEEVSNPKAIVRNKAASSNLTDVETYKAISGKVIFSEDGSPLPGVTILIPGSPTSFITDANGGYAIQVPKGTTELSFSFIGLQTQLVKLGEQTTVNVQMSADATQLSEVVVVGTGLAINNENDDIPIRWANPIGGRRVYNKYLERNLHYPELAKQNKVEGKVTVQFIVDISGELTNLTVVRGLGYGCDDEVVRLVKEGPKWQPTMRADTPLQSTVRVRVKFKLPN